MEELAARRICPSVSGWNHSWLWSMKSHTYFWFMIMYGVVRPVLTLLVLLVLVGLILSLLLWVGWTWRIFCLQTHMCVCFCETITGESVPSPQSHFIRPEYFICICFGILSCSLVFKTCGYTNILYLSYEKCKFHKRGDQKTMCILWIALLSV